MKGQNILLYILSFMLALVDGNIGINYSIFALAIFAATTSNGIPVGVLFVITMIGTLLKFQTSGLLSYAFTSALFIVMVLIFKPKTILEEYQNEKRMLGKFVFLAIFLGQVITMIWQPFLLYNLLLSISAGFIGYIFYKIFSKSIIVIKDITKKKVFALEEIMGATLMVSIASTALGDFKILGLQLGNVISILLVLVLGWKNGILVGTTSGVTVGVVLGIITESDPMLIAAFALSGLIAGILSKFGKPGVIVGFIAGNLLLTYVYNGNMIELIHFKEILVASLVLILIPNKLEINIADLFGKNDYLEEGAKYRLQESTQMAEKLNNVSDVIKQMSDTYQEVATTAVDEKEMEENNLEIFIENIQEEMQGLQENILYDDLMGTEEVILEDMFHVLKEQGRMTRESLIDIFKQHNSYIVGFDSYDISLKIEKDIHMVLKAINTAYQTSNSQFVVKAKVSQTNQTVSNQLKGVSKAIDSIKKEIEEQQQEDTFLTEKKEIISLCKQRKIQVLNIAIHQEDTGRYIVHVYLNTCSKDEIIQCPTEKIQEILYQVLKEKIVLSQEKCGVKKDQTVCHQTYISQDKYAMQIGIAKRSKEGQTVSGDSSIQIKLKDGKYLIGISDGMGSGPEARKSSQIAVKMLGRLLANGFDKETSIELINNTILANSEVETYTTLDVMILDLYAGKAEYIKNGAAPSYIKNKKKVDIMKSVSLPTGILSQVDLVVYERDLEDGDIIVMCTDGITDSNQEYKNKELWVQHVLENTETTSSKKIADMLLQESIDNYYGKAKDDMLVIVTKIKKK